MATMESTRLKEVINLAPRDQIVACVVDCDVFDFSEEDLRDTPGEDNWGFLMNIEEAFGEKDSIDMIYTLVHAHLMFDLCVKKEWWTLLYDVTSEEIKAIELECLYPHQVQNKLLERGYTPRLDPPPHDPRGD